MWEALESSIQELASASLVRAVAFKSQMVCAKWELLPESESLSMIAFLAASLVGVLPVDIWSLLPALAFSHFSH